MGGAPEHPPSVSLLVANEMEGTGASTLNGPFQLLSETVR